MFILEKVILFFNLIFDILGSEIRIESFSSLGSFTTLVLTPYLDNFSLV